MTKPPRVSVVTPFYNAARFLGEAVDSVLAQDFTDFELLLVDDGSDDASSAIAQRYATQYPDRVRYLQHAGHANRGATVSRNFGISQSRGELIALIDSDDRWSTSKLREQIAILDRFPEVDAVCGATRYWSSWDGGEDRIVPSGPAQDQPMEPPLAAIETYPLGKAASPCPSDLLVRRRALDAIGGFEESWTGPLQLYEDQAFLTKLYLNGPIYCASKVWLDYRLHDDSCVAKVTRAGLYDDVRRHYLDWVEGYIAASPYRDDLRLRGALKRARFADRHPRLTQVRRGAERVARKVLGR